MDCNFQWTTSVLISMVLVHSIFLQLSQRKSVQKYGQKAEGIVCRSLTLHLTGELILFVGSVHTSAVSDVT